MNFYSNFLYLCNARGISPSKAAEEMGFARSAVTRWKSGGGVTDSTIAKVAEYFDVSPSIFSDTIYRAPQSQQPSNATPVGTTDPRVQRLAPFITQMTDAEIEKVLGYIQGTIAARK